MSWQRKARAGDPVRISAAAYNKFIDTAVAVEEMRRTGLQPGKANRSATHVWLRNDGSATLPPWTPVYIGSSDASAILREEPVPQVVYESGALSQQARASVVVTQEQVPPGEIGLAVASGVTYCKVGRLSVGELPRPGTTLSLRTGFLAPDTGGCATLIGNVRSLGDGTYLALVRIGVASAHFYARIGDAIQDGSAARWLYQWQEVVLSDVNEWEDMLAGRSWSIAYGLARNVLEAANTASLAYSIPVVAPLFEINGTGVRFRQVPNGTVVEMSVMQREDSTVTAVFAAPNPVWGPCSTFDALAGDPGVEGDPPSEPAAGEEFIT